MKKTVNDFRFKLKGKNLIPIVVGGMGVDISSDNLAVKIASLGGIGHVSDAMSSTVTDRHFGTHYSRDKFRRYKSNKFNSDKRIVQFDVEEIKKAQSLYVRKTMERKKGEGMIFINCMEKLTMNSPRKTLKARLEAAMDGGVDGITLSAGLHLGSLALVQDHPRFRDVLFGIIVSSVRALKVFLQKSKGLNRPPDYVIVEGPLAGGHLGFGMDWKNYDLQTIFDEVADYLKENSLDIPLIPAGGVFTGTDAVAYLEKGASAVQVATRFTVSKECGLPDNVKQKYFEAGEDDMYVSFLSPTGYPMRVLKTSPAIGSSIRPNCETYGFLLDKNGHCSYIDAYNEAMRAAKEKGEKYFKVNDKVCLCTHMRDYKLWTCGHYVYRLKDTTIRDADGKYLLLDAEHVFNDYLHGRDHRILLPSPPSSNEGLPTEARLAEMAIA